MNPKIAITCGEIKNKNETWSPVVYGQSHTYSDAIIHAGGVPFFIPFVTKKPVLRELYEMCNGLLLAGGNDVGPDKYNEKPLPETTDVSNIRDMQELQLIKWALADKKPVLAICRGMQILNVACGGTLYQDIALQVPNAADHTESTKRKDRHYLAHSINIDNDSLLAHITRSTVLRTNTHHHQSIKEIGKGMRVVGCAEDGIVEAVELPALPFVLGVQSHPESLEADMPEWHKLFKAFVGAAS